MKTIMGGFSSANQGRLLAAEAIGLDEIEEEEIDEKESLVLEELKTGKSAQLVDHNTGYGLAYTLGVEIRHIDEIKAAIDQAIADGIIEEEKEAYALEEARIRRLVAAGELPLSALEPYEKAEDIPDPEPVEEPEKDKEEKKKKSDILDKVKEIVKELTE